MKRLASLLLVLFLLLPSAAAPAGAAPTTATPQPLPFTQSWTNTGLITTSDDWSGVPGIVGYRGDDLVTTTGVDPQTVLADGTGTPADVNANRSDPDTYTTGGVTEFELGDPTIALNGSGTADAPFILLHLQTTGFTAIRVQYKLRDLDGSADDATSQVALHFRAGASGDFTNVPAGYVPDASAGPDASGLVTLVDVTLPPAADDRAEVQLRIMTTNAPGNDEWIGLDDIRVTGTPKAGDLAPAVISTVPADGATGVARDASLTITFSEVVAVAGPWFDLACDPAIGGPVAESTGPAAVFVLDPAVNFAAGAHCTVTVRPGQVHDVDANDPPDTMVAPYAWSFTVEAAGLACGDPATAIPAVQGAGPASPLAGQQVTVEGVVTGDFQGADRLNGFYLQDPDGDGDPATSDGIFVYQPGGPDVVEGRRLRVTGQVAEYNGQTELRDVSALRNCGGVTLIAAETIHLPEAVDGDLERYEGMRVRIPETLTVSQNYFLGRYGQLTLSAEGRMYVPANGNGLGDTPEVNARRMLVLDDGRSIQNPNPIPYLGSDGTLRAGSVVLNLTGFLDQGLIDSSGTIDYRLQPAEAPLFVRELRMGGPAPVKGTVRVASMNLLNYFTTVDTGAPVCGPGRDQECRGADSEIELVRQRAKLVAALTELDADVIGLVEIENTDDAATANLAAGVGGGPYAVVVPPAPGTDAIRVALIYRPAVVEPVGLPHNYQAATAAYSPLFDRPPLAQTFRQLSNGELFTVVVNHFKSKSSCPPSGPDADAGQGCWNAKRVAQAAGLLDFVADLQAADEDVLVLGDLNAYGEEDPVSALRAGGLANQLLRVPARSRYTYVFDGEAGYLDQALATGPLAKQVSGATIWHINADEPSVLDYNSEFKTEDLYQPNAYRASDHDPIVLGLWLGLKTVFLPLVRK